MSTQKTARPIKDNARIPMQQDTANQHKSYINPKPCQQMYQCREAVLPNKAQILKIDVTERKMEATKLLNPATNLHEAILDPMIFHNALCSPGPCRTPETTFKRLYSKTSTFESNCQPIYSLQVKINAITMTMTVTMTLTMAIRLWLRPRLWLFLPIPLFIQLLFLPQVPVP